MEKPSSARFIRPEHVDIELVTVAYRNRSFPVHMHDQYVMGVVESGAETLIIDGRSYEVGKGDMITIDAGTAHSNSTVGDAILRYRVFYVPTKVTRSYVGSSDLRFPAPVRSDPAAAQRLLELHRWFENGTGDKLEEESALADVVGIAFDTAVGLDRDARLPDAVRRARRYIDERFDENFGLDELADAAGVTKYHLARSFTRAHGLSPLAYRTQRRIHAAKELVLAGAPLVDIASDLGFADQSHLTRQFQTMVGISPARYREQ
tara:strand:- start:1245 stop:2033 length:789 start_codon:yes stop_codon:yes gene_type:complete